MSAPSKETDAASKDPKGRFQFRLSSMFLVPLLLSPLVLSLKLWSPPFNSRAPLFYVLDRRPVWMFTYLIVCAAAYTLIYVIVGCHRAWRTGALGPKQLVMRSVVTGGFFGSAFWLQLSTPPLWIYYIRHAQLGWTWWTHFFSSPEILPVGLGVLTFAFIGMAIGGCAGLVFSVLKSRR